MSQNNEKKKKKERKEVEIEKNKRTFRKILSKPQQKIEIRKS